MMMNPSTRYVPHSEQTRAHYERFLRDMRRWLPPGLDDDIGEIAEETLSIVCRAAAAGNNNNNNNNSSGGAVPGSMQLQRLKKELEGLFDTTLTAEALHEVLQYGRLIDDFVAVHDDDGYSNNNINNNIDGTSNGAHRRGGDDSLGDLLLMQEEGGGAHVSSSDDDDSDNDERRAARDNRRDLMKFAADVGDFTGDDNDYDDENENENNSKNGGRVTFEEIVCNPTYVRDSLRRLFPAQTVEECEVQADRVLQYANQHQVDQLTLETQLTAFLGGYDDEAVIDWIGTVAASRWAIVYGVRFAEAHNQQEKNNVIDAMREHGKQDRIVERLYQSVTGKEITGSNNNNNNNENENDYDGNNGMMKPLRRVDLEAYTFKDESTPHRHTRAVVPQGTQRAVFETHDEVILPPTASTTGEDTCTPISDFPGWAQPVFPGIIHLNPMQTKTFDCAFGSDENMLVCAPTGAGKTNVAMMTMLRAIKNAMSHHEGSINLRELKMVYVAPMKALVQEVVRTFSKRLEPLGLTVVELSGDSNTNQTQLNDAQLIVATPEKWDVVTRKSIELGVASLLKLLIIDEVHLLHNERGPVLEAIVARTLLQEQLSMHGQNIRIVGLSATLPNYIDVASFLQVDRQRGVFVFDNSYRPIPLQQTYCAVKKIKGTNQAAVMNLVAYDKVLQAAMNGEQSMVFVHSRKDTMYTATYMMKRMMEDKRNHYFVRPGSESEKILHETANGLSQPIQVGLQQLISMGFAIHHAGMSREEREMVETLFSERHIRVLVCTSTLAWGVNLPANQVIIKGTRVFNGGKGETELLSALDVLQMFGRAGRVGFGSSLGKAAVITHLDDLHYYLSVLNNQLPIESQMMRRLVDMLNAEIVLGHVESITEGVRWLQRTYFYVRMQRSPEMYGMKSNKAADPLFIHHLENLVYTATDDLRRCQMVDYDAHTRRIVSKPYGRIASFYYITSASMNTYLSHLHRVMYDVDIFRLFTLSKEFSHIIVRPEEQAQIQYLLENAPVAVRESRYTPSAKINVLLQCYISGMKLQGLPLMSELVYIKDSAQRIFKALHEICLVREYGQTAQQILHLYLMVVHQQWIVQSPVRQLRYKVSSKIFSTFIHVLESRRVSWEEVRMWSLEDLAEKLGDDRRAELAYTCIHQIPYFSIEATAKPLTRNMLCVHIDIAPDFVYDEDIHNHTTNELLLTIEHINGRILYHERLYFDKENVSNGKTLFLPMIVVPIIEPKPTHYIVRCQSFYWIGAESSVSICLMNVRLPDIAPPLIEEIHQQQSLAMQDESYRDVSTTLGQYGLENIADKIFHFAEFFTTQRDLITPIMEHTSDNIFAALPPGGGKTVIAELFILQFLLEGALLDASEEASEEAHGKNQNVSSCSAAAGGGGNATTTTTTTTTTTKRKLLYLTSHEACAVRRFNDWRFKFAEGLNQTVVKLEQVGEEITKKVEKIHEGTIILSTARALVPLIRQGTTNCLSGITHIIVDHVHLIRSPEGRWLEECLARLLSKPYIVNQGHKPARLLALSYPLISCMEVSRWMKIPAARQYNYGNSYRQLQVRLEGLEQGGYRSRREAAVVLALKELQKVRYASTPNIIFVPTARDAEELARRVVLRCRDFIPSTPCEDVEDQHLSLLLSAGVAYMHRGTSLLDEVIIVEHVDKPARHPETGAALPLILVCTFEAAWRLPAALFVTAFVCASERLNRTGKDTETSVTDCSVSELLQMSSRAANEAVVYCRSARRWVWGKLLNDPLPLEPYLRLPNDFRDTINTAVVQGRAGDMPSVLRILQTHYLLYHLRTNLHFYDVPSKDDIPAYASELARSVIASLQQIGCIDVIEGSGGDESVIVSSTVRGKAVAHYGISMETVEALEEAFSMSSMASVEEIWRLIASSCVELTPEYLGDASRINDTAEMQALQIIARSFPADYNVHYVDLDFNEGWTKVQLLVLAHCARMFATDSGVASARDGDNKQMTGIMHPFASPSTAAIDPQLLLDIPISVAEQLREDLYLLLPSVLNVIRGACELLYGKVQWCEARYLMRLSSQIERSTWIFEDPLLQLPCVQDSMILREVLMTGATDTAWSLDRLQNLCTSQDEFTPTTAAATWKKLQQTLVTSLQQHGATTHAVEKAESFLHRLRAEAAALPHVTSLSATGGVAVGANGICASVRVEGRIMCALQHSSSSLHDDVGGELLGQWWIGCVVRHDGQQDASERLVDLRTVTAERVTVSNEENEENEERNKSEAEAAGGDKESSSSHWRIFATLSVPLNDVSDEALETLRMSVVVVAARCIADAEVDVVFSAA